MLSSASLSRKVVTSVFISITSLLIEASGKSTAELTAVSPAGVALSTCLLSGSENISEIVCNNSGATSLRSTSLNAHSSKIAFQACTGGNILGVAFN